MSASHRPATVPPPIPTRGAPRSRPPRVPDPSSTTMPLSTEDILFPQDIDREVTPPERDEPRGR